MPSSAFRKDSMIRNYTKSIVEEIHRGKNSQEACLLIFFPIFHLTFIILLFEGSTTYIYTKLFLILLQQLNYSDKENEDGNWRKEEEDDNDENEE